MQQFRMYKTSLAVILYTYFWLQDNLTLSCFNKWEKLFSYELQIDANSYP